MTARPRRPLSPTAATVAATAIAVASIAGLAAPASATLTRVRALGDGASYLEDDSNALVWFASLVDYPDQVVLDLGELDHDAPGSLNESLTGVAGGFHARLDRAGRWGTAGLYVQEDLPAGAPGGAFTLLWARGLGKITVGLKGSFSSHFEGENSTEIPGHGESLYFHDYGASARWDIHDGLYGDLVYELVNVQGDATMQGSYSLPPQHTWSTWGARTRWFIALDETAALVPVFDHRQDDRQVLAEALAAPADQHVYRTAVGCGVNLLPDPDNLVVVSAEYRWGHELHDRLVDNSQTWDYDQSDATYEEVHARVGLESRVLPWLTVRGALQYLRLQNESRLSRGHTLPDEPDRWAEDQSITILTPITVGAGILAGPFQADLVLNARWAETYGTFPFARSPQERGTYTGITFGYRF
ncbi:MAG TPA: hypothetical protein PLL30_15080 [Candidatus Krumholzibacteria bacterium]|nr:hypothetical protein [Candidatus Krumholzibacteria bacterium]HPD73093.1 hypothetical protein [Candidatus Krumholzibacteria bacterium]HRY41893.1 hypothetical protein [Candidatus Krumholzibacteria bacterium]